MHIRATNGKVRLYFGNKAEGTKNAITGNTNMLHEYFAPGFLYGKLNYSSQRKGTAGLYIGPKLSIYNVLW